MSREQYLRKLRTIIAEYGWAVQGLGADHERRSPGFCYTVGLTAKGMPEILVLGLPMNAAQGILNDLSKRLVAGDAIPDGVDIHEIASMPMRLQTVAPVLARRWVKVADAIAGTPVAVRQLLWPDREGRFPSDTGVDPQMAAIQNLALHTRAADE